MRRGRVGAQGLSLALLAMSMPVVGQEQAAVTPEKASETPATVTTASASSLPKLTPVAIEILDPLGSKTSKSLDTFRIALAEPLMLDGVVLVPAGTPGQGEVVHAKKAGGMGAAGELVIAARYLDLGDRHLALRSTKLDLAGKSRIDGVSTLALASAATPLPIAMVGFFIKGGEIELPAGTRALAKLAEDFVPAPGIGAAPEAPVVAPAAADQNGGKTE